MLFMKSNWARRGLRAALAALSLVAVLALAACGSSDDRAGSSDTGDAKTTAAAAADYNLISDGTLTVGMNLQFKPEMYLEGGEPAGYDPDVLNALASSLGLKLEIKNLDFNGLIPGLVSKQFDMVSVGLSPTPERRKAIDFSGSYVPYVQVLAVPAGGGADSIDAYNQSGKTITALQGSTAEQLARSTFPKAEVKSFSDQTAAFLEVASGRADGVVVEDYLLAQYQKSNPDRLEKAPLPEPLDVQYGAWGVQKGNTALTEALDDFLCRAGRDGTLADLYKQDFGVQDAPDIPSC
jgi:ABC-type amino acid transport substrate-binding protein